MKVLFGSRVQISSVGVTHEIASLVDEGLERCFEDKLMKFASSSWIIGQDLAQGLLQPRAVNDGVRFE